MSSDRAATALSEREKIMRYNNTGCAMGGDDGRCAVIVQTAQINSLKTSGGFKPLKRLSDGDLLGRLMKARGTERAMQQRFVLYLAEVERRRLYLPLAYGSLFEFCTDYLKYSRSSATRRISDARCIARYPRMAELFRRGECELTVLATIAEVVTKDNCAEIAVWLTGRSLREVEAYVQRRQPERALRDRVRQIYVMSAQPAGEPRNGAAPRGKRERRSAGGNRQAGVGRYDGVGRCAARGSPNGGGK